MLERVLSTMTERKLIVAKQWETRIWNAPNLLHLLLLSSSIHADFEWSFRIGKDW